MINDETGFNHISSDRDGSFCVNLTRGPWFNFKPLILLIFFCRTTDINSDESQLVKSVDFIA